MGSQKSFNAPGRDETLSELELESLLIEDGPDERDVDSRSGFSSTSYRPDRAPRWARKLLGASVRQGGFARPICPTTRTPGSIRRMLRHIIFMIAVATGVYVGMLLFTLIPWSSSDPFDDAFAQFRQHSDHVSIDSPHYPTRYFQSVLPVPCHSHNDYWRRTPLYAALGSGCISVEADVWYFENDQQEPELFVGHTTAALSNTATLRSMYIDPLVNIIERMNAANSVAGRSALPRGVFYQNPNQALSLLIDFKTDGASILPYVHAQLAPLRDRGWLTHWNGSARTEGLVTIVATGNAPFDLLVANTTYRDIFYDAPLDKLQDSLDPDLEWTESHEVSPFDFKYNPSNSYMASAPFLRALDLNQLTFSVPHIRGPPLSEAQTDVLRRQISNARIRGLVPRYWGTPRWPRALRDGVWEVLYDEGIGLLNVDDLRAARKGNWGSK